MSETGEPSLGEFLRQEREKRGITIEQIASATKINVRLLQHLENDHYSDLPALPFIRGFVISYLRFLGVDADPVLSNFNSFLEERADERPRKDKGHSGYAFEKKDTERSRTILWFVMGGFVVLGGIAIFLLKPALRHRPAPQVALLQKKEAQEAPQSKSLAESSKADSIVVSQDAKESGGESGEQEGNQKSEGATDPQEVASASDELETKPPGNSVEPNRVPTETDDLQKGDSLDAERIRHKVVLRALDDIWLRYQVDSKRIMKVRLLKDRLLVLRASERIFLQVSDAEQAEYRYRLRGFLVLDQSEYLTRRNQTPTLFFPYELAKNESDPFPGLGPLLQSVE